MGGGGSRQESLNIVLLFGCLDVFLDFLVGQPDFLVSKGWRPYFLFSGGCVCFSKQGVPPSFQRNKQILHLFQGNVHKGMPYCPQGIP